jgi:hypothetical protein
MSLIKVHALIFETKVFWDSKTYIRRSRGDMQQATFWQMFVLQHGI